MQPAELSDVLHDIPEEYRERFVDLLDHTTLPVERVVADVEQYLATVEAVARMAVAFDADQARRLANTALALLADLDDESHPRSRALVQAAAHYFVHEDEDEEVTGVLGFDDDTQVLNAVCRGLGRPDLVIPLQRR